MPSLRVQCTVRNLSERINYGTEPRDFVTLGSDERSGVIPMDGNDIQVSLAGLSAPSQVWLENVDTNPTPTQIQVGKAATDYFCVLHSDRAPACFERDPSVTTLFCNGPIGSELRYQIYNA